MLLSLDAVVIVLSEGVKDTTALDEGVVIVVPMSCNVCGRYRAQGLEQARTLQLLQCGGCVLSHSLPIYECVVDA